MRRKDQLTFLIRSRRIQKQPNELLRELRVERVFEFVDQIDARLVDPSRPIQDGQQVQVADAAVGFLLKGKPELLVSIPVHGD